jgi:hypothetical protein
MAEENTQPVVTEPNAAAQPAAEARTDAPAVEELDTLLAQYESTVTPAAAAPAAVAKTEPKPDDLNTRIERIAAYQEAEISKSQKAELKQALDDATKVIKGDLPDSIASSKLALGWLKTTADDDPRLQAAFKNRAADPAGWSKILVSLSKEFAKEMKRPDANTTEDREAVTAAVRGATSQAPATKDPVISKLTDNELRAETKAKWGYIPHF